MLVVHLQRPVVQGDTLHLSWRTEHGSLPFRQQACAFRYQGIDLAPFSPTLFVEIAIALLTPVIAASGPTPRLVLPFPVPRAIADFWRAYNAADHLEITPLSDETSYSPWLHDRPAIRDERPIAVFYGGGKDSLLATSLAAELEGGDRILLVKYLEQRNLDGTSPNATRRDRLMLEPVRQALGVSVQRVFTNFQEQFLPSARSLRPHIEFFSAAGLPALLSYGVRTAMFVYNRHSYRIDLTPSGPSYHYRRSRLETLAAQNRHLQRTLGLDLEIANPGYALTNYAAYKVLSERYPHHLAFCIPCVQPDASGPWCGQCVKCHLYAWMNLANGGRDARDNTTVFGSCRRLLEALDVALQTRVSSTGSNAPWQARLCRPSEWAHLSHAIALADPDLVAGRLDETALTNLLVAKSLWGNAPQWHVEMISRAGAARLTNPLVQRMTALAGEHLGVVDDLRGIFITEGGTSEFGDSVVMPLHPYLASLVASGP